jgi:pimeloyl-ACP methyl ester carboxylesterase
VRRPPVPFLSWRALVIVVVMLGVPFGFLGTAHSIAVSALIDAPNHGRTPPASVPPDDAELLRVTRFDGAVIEAFVLSPRERVSRGTVLMFHGIRDDKRGYVSLARQLAARGFRTLAVDLRGHGASSGDYLTYGLADHGDASALLDALEDRGTSLGPVATIGASYGGAVALQTASHDHRVRAVATIATFANVRDLLPSYGHQMAPFLPTPPQWFISWGLATAHDRTGLDLEASDSTVAIRTFTGPVLLQHGEDDTSIPIAHADRLAEACGARCTLIRTPGATHQTILSDGAVWSRAFDFVETSLDPRVAAH